RVRRGVALPLLATPTHRGGHLAPAAFERRLRAWREAGETIEPHDALLALSRLPPDERGEARRALAGVDDGEALDEAAQPRGRYTLSITRGWSFVHVDREP